MLARVYYIAVVSFGMRYRLAAVAIEDGPESALLFRVEYISGNGGGGLIP